MRASACFEFDGMSYRCVWVIKNTLLKGSEVTAFPMIKRVYVRGDYVKAPRAGQYCRRPHKLIK